ncbi:YhcN/YlaJ family sporulation lipoprotein [Siminovitchia sp. 179-K 8D1 HS]|uniref:YhcN/YlaJ family sporulation lipoprotein n=1 Tax=Siminovitchia sp. 179-K 8D1 HS TaxID=3142385 RepID=UPI0039A20341
MKKALISICILLLAACGQANNMETNENEPRPQGVSTRNEEMADNNRRADIDKASHLAKLASQVPGVKGARAVVAGDYAVVGIDVDENLDRSKVGTLKYSVAESIKHDPLGAGAVVVADPDVNARIEEINNDFAAGQPLQGILNELADITGRVIPELPQREMNKNPQEAPQKPKQEMKQKEDRRLNREQERQSTEE